MTLNRFFNTLGADTPRAKTSTTESEEKTMEVRLEERDKKTFLIIECEVPPVKKLPKSKSGKNLLLATTKGNMKTDVKFGGKEVVLGLNAYIDAED